MNKNSIPFDEYIPDECTDIEQNHKNIDKAILFQKTINNLFEAMKKAMLDEYNQIIHIGNVKKYIASWDTDEEYKWRVEFKVDTCLDWTFGLDIEQVEKERVMYTLFAQPDKYIDKFKPSASYLFWNYSVYIQDTDDDYKKQFEGKWIEASMINLIMKYPEIALYKHLNYVSDPFTYITLKGADEYIKEMRKKEQKEEKEIRKNNNKIIRFYKHRLRKCIVIDKGEDCIPRYDICVKEGDYEDKIVKDIIYKCTNRFKYNDRNSFHINFVYRLSESKYNELKKKDINKIK